MPNTYLLTIYDDEGGHVETPFAAPNDLKAERDAHAYMERLGRHLSSITGYTLETLEIGGYDPEAGLMMTSRPALLFDSRTCGVDADPIGLPCSCARCLEERQARKGVPA